MLPQSSASNSARAEHAELVAFGVGQDDPGDVGALTHVGRPRAELDESSDSASRSSPANGATSRWTRFLTDLASATATKSRSGSCSSGPERLTTTSLSKPIRQPDAASQNRAIAAGDSASTTIAAIGPRPQIPLPRFEHAELVAFRIRQHDPRHLVLAVVLTDVDVPGAALDQPVDQRRLVLVGGGRQVEMHPILGRLRLRHGARTRGRARSCCPRTARPRPRPAPRTSPASRWPRTTTGRASTGRRSRSRRSTSGWTQRHPCSPRGRKATDVGATRPGLGSLAGCSPSAMMV